MYAALKQQNKYIIQSTIFLKSVSFKKAVEISSTQEIGTEFTHFIYCTWVNSVQISWVLEISTVFLKETDFKRINFKFVLSGLFTLIQYIYYTKYEGHISLLFNKSRPRVFLFVLFLFVNKRGKVRIFIYQNYNVQKSYFVKILFKFSFSNQEIATYMPFVKNKLLS